MKKRLIAISLGWLFSFNVTFSQTCREWFLTVNQQAGTFTVLDSIRQDCWVIQGSEFFNSYTHRYHFQGRRDAGGNRFYTCQPGAAFNAIYDSLTPAITGCNYIAGASNDQLNKNYTLAVTSNTAGIISQLYVDSIDPATSNMTHVLPIAALTGTNISISQFLYDDAGNRFFLFYAHPAGGFRISVVDGANGSVLNTVSVPAYGFNMQYDPASGLLYGIQSAAGGAYNLISIDPSNGNLIAIAAIPGLAGSYTGATLYKAQRWYSFFGIDASGHPHLFTIDLSSGSILYDLMAPSFAAAACTPPPGMGIGSNLNGNILMPAYDQSNGMLYCLHWGIPPQDIVTTISQELSPAQWKIYPNPSEGLLHIEGGNNGEYAVELTDVFGRKLYTGRNCREIDLGPFVPGFYQLKIISNHGISSIKLVRGGN